MAQNHPEGERVRTLWDISCDVVKKKVCVSVDLVCGLPQPVAEELAVLFPWIDLIKLEEFFKNTHVADKGWERLFKGLPAFRYELNRQSSCSHCDDQLHIPWTFRDRWMAISLSSYLQQTHFKWKTLPAGATSDLQQIGFLKCPPGMVLSQFHGMVMRCLGQVRTLTMRLNTLLQLRDDRPVLRALCSNLTVLRLDFFSLVQCNAWLQVIKELMVKGQLKSLNLINLGTSFRDWLLLLFIVSGLFHCRLCAQHFSMGMAQHLNARTTTHVHSSCHRPRAAAEGQETYENRAEPSDDCLAPLQNCVEQIYADTSQLPNPFADARSHSARVGQLQLELSHCFSSGLCWDFVKVLKDIGYEGLAGWDERQRTGTASSAQDACTWEEGLTPKKDKGGCDSEGGVCCVRTLASSSSSSSAAEDFDLLDEALGVWSNPLFQERGLRCEQFINFGANVRLKDANLRLMEVLSQIHTEEGHTSRGLEHISANWGESLPAVPKDDTTLSLDEALGCYVPAWPSLSSLTLEVVRLTPLFRELTPLGEVNPTSIDSQYCLDALLCQIRANCLHSVVINCFHRDPWESLCRFFWQTLWTLAGAYHSHPDLKRTQPMQLLKIDCSPRCRVMFKPPKGEGFYEFCSARQGVLDENGDSTDTSSWPGLQELFLKNVMVSDDAFVPLAQFIKGNHALRHISLHGCELNPHCLSLLLDALLEGEHQQLACMDLHCSSSVDTINEAQWNKVCRILQQTPSLTHLSLIWCDLKGEFLNWPKFVDAVKSHGSKRCLRLDISHNRQIGDSIWDFITKAVQPGSSLKELHFQDTGSTAEQGRRVMTNFLGNQVPHHLPLLHNCSWTFSHYDQHVPHVSSCLQKIAHTVDVQGSMAVEYVAMM